MLVNANIPNNQKVTISYRDSDNDKICVTDDYELQMAYATALSADNKVKFHVELPNYKPVVVEKPVEKPVVVEKPIEKPVIVEPAPIVVAPLPEPVQPPKVESPKFVEQPKVEVPVIEAEIEDAESPEDEDEHHHPHPHGKKGKKGKKGKGKKGKCGGGAANMPRKAIKNLIRAELESAVPGIYDKLIKEFEEEPVAEPINVEESKEPQVVHKGIECDGCGTSPILGIRYKCAVCKDFDYCAKCEDSLGHDHPFLKIRNAGGAPTQILTVLREDAQGNQIQPDWKQMKETWKNIRQQCKPEGGCWKKKEWTEEECAQKAEFWKNMVGGFLSKMGMKDQDIDQLKQQWKQQKEQWK